jgi:TrmH family RNA methyltransferase
MVKYKRYKKEIGYSYSLGIFLTLELLQNKPDKVIEIIISNQTEASEGVGKIIKHCKTHHVPYSTNDKLINSLSSKGNCYVIGIFSTYNDPMHHENNHIVLVNPSDAGNLGTIIRAALGFNITDLAIIRPAVDIFDPKTIRASMGSLFSINFTYYDSFIDYEENHRTHQLYPFMLQAEKKLKEVIVQSPFALVFGNEATGLNQDYQNKGTSVIIPHSTKIDSLNLATAAAIAMYEFTKTEL